MSGYSWPQIKAVVRIETKKTFFAKRGLWIYFLAFAPVALFLIHSLVEINSRGGRQQMAMKSERPLNEGEIAAIHEGMTREQVIAALGNAPASRARNIRRRTGRHEVQSIPGEVLSYSDGNQDFRVYLENGTVVGTSLNSAPTLGNDSYVFASVFQFFFVRLAIFFGCLGIFMNLFRGEMLDRSLHYYLLAPIRREALVLGKYLAGLLAASIIFFVSVVLQLIALLIQFDAATVSNFLYQGHGLSQIAAYVAVTILACVGYGTIFLAAGLLFRNPIIPAAIVLIWESANPLLPALLKKISIIYYLKSLCPVQAPVDVGVPPLLALLVSNPEPVSAYTAVLGLLTLSACVLVVSTRRVRRLEINYTTD